MPPKKVVTKPPQVTGGVTVKPLKIGDVASRAGVGVETVRYYERRGLLKEPARNEAGYRQYAEDAVPRLRFIRRAKELGFTLKEIGELLDLRLDPSATKADVKQRAEAKIIVIKAKIRDLQRTRAVLVKLTAACPGYGPLDDCPILEALEESGRA